MMKEEFEQRIGREVSAEEYEMIEYVYTWHPLINAVYGKDQIAAIYNMPGGAVFVGHMLPVARKAEQYQRQIDAKRAEVERAQKELNDMIARFKGCQF